jgi:hypothetical protein
MDLALLIIYGLVGINSLIFAIPYFSSLNLFELFQKDNWAINNGEYYRLLTCTFLHADIFFQELSVLCFHIGFLQTFQLVQVAQFLAW